MTDACTESRFLTDVKDHAMIVIRDGGFDRHLRFKKPGTGSYSFDLLTWTGHLCITGDCGTYVFRRLNDMFKFFRVGPEYAASHPDRKLFINTGYWGEKLLSVSTHAGYLEFSEELFQDTITQFFSDHCEAESPTEEDAEALWCAIEDTIFSAMYDGECAAYQAVHDFEYGGFQFEDFFDDGGTEEYTFNYLWCLYGIVWGISQYDAFKDKNKGKE